jgi:hypothetical protein
MEIVDRANLKCKNDRLGMLLELATVQALKNIPLYVERHSQFNEFYQQDRSTGPDVIFEFDDHTTGCIECKNVNPDFIVSKDWFKNSVEKRFFPVYRDLASYIVVISQFVTSPSDLANKLRERYHIIEVSFQVVDQITFEGAIDIITHELKIVVESKKKNSISLK